VRGRLKKQDSENKLSLNFWQRNECGNEARVN